MSSTRRNVRAQRGPAKARAMPRLLKRFARIAVALAAVSCAPRRTSADAAESLAADAALPAAVRVEMNAPISLREEAGVPRVGAPATVGVPVPLAAKISDVSSLRVVDENGKPIDAQLRVLSRWDAARDDRSAPARWLLARFPADVGAHATRRFTLRGGEGEVTAAAPLLARSEGGTIVVENGGFRASFGPAEPGPLVLVATASGAGAKPVRGEKTTSVRVEENGPLVAEVRVEGELPAGFEQTAGASKPLRWIARWTFRRGEPGARVLFTIENPDRPYEKPYNDRGAVREKRFASLVLELAAEDRALKTPVKTVKFLPKGSRGNAWIARGGKAGWTVLGMRRFAENGPKGVASRKDGSLVLELFPKAAALGGSRAKSHDLFLLALPASADPAKAALAAGAPLVGAADPEWLRDSQALGLLSIEDGKRFPDFERTADAIAGVDGASRDGTLWVERERTNAYGWMDFGDSLRGKDAKARRFGSNEFDFGWVLLRQWLRESDHDTAWRELAEDTLRHTMDVDVMHTAEDAGWANHGMRKHDTSSTEGHSHGPDFSHFWLRGIVAWHLATGDGRARDVAVEELGAWIAAREEKDIPGALRFADEMRDVGWAMVALTDLYELDGDPEKLALARRIAGTMVLPNLRPDGSMGGASFLNRKESFAPWQQAYIADGLGRLALIGRRRGAKDAEVEAALKKMLGFLCGDGAWVRTPTVLYGRTYEESIAFSVGADGKKTVEEASMSQALADPATFGFLLFDDPALRACAEKSARYTFPDGPEAYWKPDSGTPAKNAAVKLYFGEAFRWLRQTRSDASGASSER